MADPTPEEAKARATQLFRQIKNQTTQAKIKGLAVEGIEQMSFISLQTNPLPVVNSQKLIEVTAGQIVMEWTSSETVTQWATYLNGLLVSTIPGGIPVLTFSYINLTPSTDYVTHVQAISNGLTAYSVPFPVRTGVNTAPVWNLTPQTLTGGEAYSLDLTGEATDVDEQPLTFAILSGSVPGITLSGSVLAGTPSTLGTYPLQLDVFDGYAHATTTVDFVVAGSLDASPPSVPQNPLAIANGNDVTISWSPSIDNESGVRRYRIHRNGVFSEFSNTSPLIQTGLADAIYTYTIYAEDNANFPADGNISAASAPAVIEVDVVPPAAGVPLQFTVTPGTTRNDLSWQANPAGNTPTDYDIDFSTVGPSGPWTPLTVVGTGTTFAHTGLTAITHWYRLLANPGPSAYTTGSGTPLGGAESPHFIVLTSVDSIDCRALRDVNNVVRKVAPGDIIQINERIVDAGTPATVFQIEYPEGTAAKPIRVVPEPNKQVVFQRWDPSGGFAFIILGPRGTTVSTADQTKYGHITIDGFTTSGSVPTNSFDGKKHGFKFMPSVNNTSSDNPTNAFRSRGFISGLKLRYCWFDYRGATRGTAGGITKNESEFQRSDYPGVFRGSSTLEHILVDNCGSTYMGQNFGPGYLPSRDTTIRYNMFLNGGQTPVLVKNNWEGYSRVHHNIIKHSGNNPGVVIQRNSISMTASAGECHHNWCEDTGQGVIGFSENKVQAMRFDCNDGPYRAPFQGYPGYTSIELKVYSNVIFRAVEGGMTFSSSNSRTTDLIAEYLAKVYSNTVDDVRNPGGGLEIGISFSKTRPGSFCRNNIVTRTAGISGIPTEDVSRNTVDNTISRFVNVYSYSTYQDYLNAAETEKNYKLATAVAAYVGSTPGVDLATTDFASAYDGSAPTQSAEEADDYTRVGPNYDRGALEKV